MKRFLHDDMSGGGGRRPSQSRASSDARTLSDASALSEELAIGEIRNRAWRMRAASSFSGELSQGEFVGAILTLSPASRALEHKPRALRLGSPPLRSSHQENRAIGLSASA